MFNSQAFISTIILVSLFFMAYLTAQVTVLHRWWLVKFLALLVTLMLLAAMVAHIAYLIVGV